MWWQRKQKSPYPLLTEQMIYRECVLLYVRCVRYSGYTQDWGMLEYEKTLEFNITKHPQSSLIKIQLNDSFVKVTPKDLELCLDDFSKEFLEPLVWKEAIKVIPPEVLYHWTA